MRVATATDRALDADLVTACSASNADISRSLQDPCRDHARRYRARRGDIGCGPCDVSAAAPSGHALNKPRHRQAPPPGVDRVNGAEDLEGHGLPRINGSSSGSPIIAPSPISSMVRAGSIPA